MSFEREANVSPVFSLRALAAAWISATAAVALGDDVPRVRGEVRVERVLVDVHATNARGEPLLGLSAADFRVRVDGVEVVVESADWIPADRPEAAEAGEARAGEAPREPSAEASAARAAEPAMGYPPGRLLVVFFQTDFTRRRLSGQIRMVAEAERLLESLLPTDRVAVLSFDSHLKLRADFTDDRETLREAIAATLRTDRPPRLAPGPFPSLAAHFDFDAAERAASVDRGLAVTAKALLAFPGGKSLLYFGWGTRVDRSPRESHDFAEAVQALTAARTNVFVLDVSDADFHTLEVGLMAFADVMGGTYEKTHVFTRNALARTLGRISGRYVLSFEKPALPPGVHRIEVTLASRSGEVHARETYADAEP